jgi:hypothetical protein
MSNLVRAVLGLLVLLTVTGCGSRSYHEYALTHSMSSSKQREHLYALKSSTNHTGLERYAQACIYYPPSLGAFSTGCGQVRFSPYQMASR